MTNGEIDRLGVRIGQCNNIAAEDLNSLQEFRKTFQRPLAEVFEFVTTTARRLDKGCIVTYRIKRIDTIIEKLKRFLKNEKGDMKLSRMWDIAGCRCIFPSSDEKHLYTLLDKIKEEYGSDCKFHDYVKNPRETGYRSIHIYVKDKLTGKPVEIQIRNYRQHNWSTLVEILDVLYGKSIKEGKEKGELEEFMRYYSNTSNLTLDEFQRLLSIGDKYRIFERMSSTLTKNYLNIKCQWLQQPKPGSYFVIEANKDGSNIQSFCTFDDAENEYYDKYVNCRDSNIVLTHIPNATFDQISMAYSNYVLAMHAFFNDYRSLVENLIIISARNNKFLLFRRCFRIYHRNLKSHFKNLSIEADNIAGCIQNKRISRSQVQKWINEMKHRINNWAEETSSFWQKLQYENKNKFYYRMIIKYEIKHLEKDMK